MFLSGINCASRCAALSTFLIVFAGCFSQERALLDKPVLTVNGKDVSAKEYADRLALRLKSFDALYAKDESNLDRAKEDTAQAFILEIISRDFANKNGLSVENKEVEKQVDDIRSKYPDDFAFRRAFADGNLSIERWRKDLEFTLLQKKIFALVTAKAPSATEAEQKKYYDENRAKFQRAARVRLRQVVLEKEDDARRILEELTNGANFESLAKKYSIAPEGRNGGDTGWLEKGTLDVFDLAFKMSIGQRSKVLKSPYGWHIYEILKKEPEAHLSFDAAKAKIQAHLLEVQTHKIFAQWAEEQIRKSSVKRNDGLIRSIKVSTKGS